MYDVIIIGAGPAGLSAALWCDELGLDTLVLEQGSEIGGQLLSVYNRIENYLGVRARDGREIRDLFAEQVRDAEFDLWTDAEIESVDLKSKRVALRSGEELQSHQPHPRHRCAPQAARHPRRAGIGWARRDGIGNA